jgi:hypothetical protein
MVESCTEATARLGPGAAAAVRDRSSNESPTTPDWLIRQTPISVRYTQRARPMDKT